MKRKALIISIKGTKLSYKEKLLFTKEKPWGVILFKRNLKSLDQIKNLVSNIKNLTKNKHFPVLIDEEGSSVTRLRNIINNDISANFFGNLYKENKTFALRILRHYVDSLSNILINLGIIITFIFLR